MQKINSIARQDETARAGDVIDADRHRAHAFFNDLAKGGAAAIAGNFFLQDRFIRRNGAQGHPALIAKQFVNRCE